jgi:O-antigen/teichoic acid export membrane protein
MKNNNKTKDDYKPEFGIDVSINFATQILIFCLSVVSSIIIARALGPEGKGLYELARMIPTMTVILASVGISHSNIYFIGKNKYPIGQIVGNVLFYSIIIGGTVTFILLILAPYLNNYFLKDASQIYLYTTLPLIPFLMISGSIYYVLLGYRKMVKLSILRLINPLTYLIILVIIYYLFQLSVYGAIWAYISGHLVCLSLGIYFLVKSGYCTGLTLNKALYKESFKFGFKQYLGTIFQLLNYRLDMLIIAVLLTSMEVGHYSVSVIIAETIWYIPVSLGQVLYPKTASSDTKAANTFTPLVCKTNIILTFIAVLILCGISGIIIPWLFTTEFYPSVMALRLLLPGTFFLGISKVLGSDLTGRGFPQYSTYAALVSLIFTIILDFLLIPHFGINGAALASSISYMISALIITYLFIRTTKVRPLDLLIIRAEDIIDYRRVLKVFYK